MATAVLPSQDYLKFRSTPKVGRNAIPSPTRTVRRKRRYPAVKDNGDTSPPVVKFPSRSLVMEKVTILKRGEDLKSSPFREQRSDGGDAMKAAGRNEDEDSMLCSTDRLGPEPEMVPTQVRLTVRDSSGCGDSLYAGAAFFSSPSPSSLPLPAFFSRKNNDVATKDLRRLLRLEL
ncbi:uncharacterized protein LOC131257020 [Magnolia sinica]|uniref:uncharacterized protein LOC131257020 n=1 Tax=Magnolia sinica TaxID=86752 RepID=UPI00265B3EE0|nr:uncharacterized protein LOC131257020 [Magnolia sinica]